MKKLIITSITLAFLVVAVPSEAATCRISNNTTRDGANVCTANDTNLFSFSSFNTAFSNLRVDSDVNTGFNTVDAENDVIDAEIESGDAAQSVSVQTRISNIFARFGSFFN